MPLNTPIAGSNGGTLTVAADGAATFDQNGDFASLAKGASVDTSFTIDVSDNASATATFTHEETVARATTAPGQVTGLAAAPGDGQIMLSWTAPVDDGGTPLTDYLVERSDAGGAFTAVTDGVGTGVSFTDTGLTNDTLYAYLISAINAVGTGTASAEVSDTPVAPGGSGSAFIFDANDSGSLTLTGSDVDAWASTGSDTSSLTNQGGNNGATFTDPGGTDMAYVEAPSSTRDRLINNTISLANAEDMTVMAVVADVDGSNADDWLRILSAGSHMMEGQLIGNARHRIYYNDGTSTSNAFQSATGSVGEFRLWTFDVDAAGGNVNFYLGASTTPAQSLSIGSDGWTATALELLIEGGVALAYAEIAVGLSQAEREAQQAALATRFATRISTVAV